MAACQLRCRALSVAITPRIARVRARVAGQARPVRPSYVPSPFLSPQACIDDNVDMVTFLVEHGASIDQPDNEGWLPLHAAASCGYLDIAA